MPINLDILYLTSGISRCAFLTVFLVTVICQPDERCLRHWLAALAASAAGCLCMALSPSYPMAPFPLSLITTTLFFTSLVLSWSGLRLFYGRRIHPRALTLLGATPATLLLLMQWLELALPFQLSVLFLVNAIMTILAIVEILRPPRRRILSQYVVALAFAVYFMALLIPFIMLVTGLIQVEMMINGQVAIMADQVLSILIYFGFIAMTGERANMMLKRLAQTDQLTGLANRRAVQEMLKRQHKHRRTDRISSVVIIDIDHFKSVNDRWGHDTGDGVLIHFARHLSAVIRQQDLAVRWGGEEFLILLPDTSIDDAERLAERLRHRIETTPVVLKCQTLEITISLGVAAVPHGTDDTETSIHHADEALYRAKRAGRNRVCRFDRASSAAL